MSQGNWIPYPNVPWLHYAPCGCQMGGFYILDQRNNQTFHSPDMNGVHQYAADNSGGGLGNAVHRVTQAMGIPRCSKCARRQTFLNRLFK